MSDAILPTNRAEAFTADGVANYNRLMKSVYLNRPIRTIWSPHVAGMESETPVLLGSGPPALTELNSSGIVGVRFATTDTMSFLWKMPADVDITKDIEIRMIHSNKVKTAGTILWTWLYEEIPLGGSVALAAATQAMDEDAAAQNAHSTAFAPQAQGWCKISGNTLSLTPGVDSLNLLVTNTLVTLADSDALYAEARYYSKYMNAFSL